MFSYILLSISITAHQAMRALSVLIIAAQRQAYQPSLLSSLCFLVTFTMQSNRHRAQSWLMKSAVNALSMEFCWHAAERRAVQEFVCLLCPKSGMWTDLSGIQYHARTAWACSAC